MNRLVFGKAQSDGRDVWLPDEPSEKMAIAGISGSGKSYRAMQIAEQWMRAGRRVVAIDPVGIWYGLRTGADGDPSGGMPIRIYGGTRMDEQVPQPDEAARRIVLGRDWSAIFDLSCMPFESVHWWCAEFLNTVGSMGPQVVAPFNIMAEEAPILFPQTGTLSKYQSRCKAAFAQCARVYRNFGVGMTVITQRFAATDKNIVSQAGTILAMRIAAKIDKRAILDWVQSSTAESDGQKILDGLATAQPGQGMLWAPTWGSSDMRAVRMSGVDRSTYHVDPRNRDRNLAVELCAPPRNVLAPAPQPTSAGSLFGWLLREAKERLNV